MTEVGKNTHLKPTTVITAQIVEVRHTNDYAKKGFATNHWRLLGVYEAIFRAYR